LGGVCDGVPVKEREVRQYGLDKIPKIPKVKVDGAQKQALRGLE